jgi:hypothetical protein
LLSVNAVSMTAIDANGIAPTGPYTLKLIKTPSGALSLGCSMADFGALAPNTIAVVSRGTCARVAKAIFGQQAGAAAVIMVNNANSLPPFEGPITSNPDDGVPYTVTIPFLGVTSSDGAKLAAQSQGSSVATVAQNIANPGYTRFASFSSAGPRTSDSAAKPDITAPGVSIFSTAVGSGAGGEILSGTSMASPHVAGAAALTRQAHPAWSVADIKAAIVNTGAPSLVADYATSRGGTGVVQPARSTQSQVVARSKSSPLGVALNFGYAELAHDFIGTTQLRLHNNGSTPATFKVAQANAAGSPHAVSFSESTITVAPNADAQLVVQLRVPAATAGDSSAFNDVGGLVQLTPASPSDNAGVALRVPYHLVPHALSDVSTSLGKLTNGANPTTTAKVSNKGVIAGDADFYAWGLSDASTGNATNDVRAIGVQSFGTGDPDVALMVFAVNGYNRWSNASVNEFDIYVDVDGDGKDDYVVVGVDDGIVRAGDFNGVRNTFVLSQGTGAGTFLGASAPTDSSTALLVLTTDQLCLPQDKCLSRTASPRLSYHYVSYDLFRGAPMKVGSGLARFNPWNSAISQGGFATVPPRGSASVPIQVNSAEWALTPAKGVMVVTLDNAAGAQEAQLLGVAP